MNDSQSGNIKFLQKIEDYKIQIGNLNDVIVKINSLSNYFEKIEDSDSKEEIFTFFLDEIKKIFTIDYASLFLLAENELDFDLVAISDNKKEAKCLDIFKTTIKSGVFGWSINQNRFSLIPQKIKSHRTKGIGYDEFILMIFPLKRNKKVFGTLLAVIDEYKSAISKEQRTYFSIIYKQLSLALGNAIYLEKINKQNKALVKYRKKTEKELLAAKKIQQNIIKKEFDDIKNTSFFSIYMPYEKIGGDYYDVVKIHDRRFVAVIADVSGHGVPAALGTATIKSAVYSNINPAKFNFDVSVKKLYNALMNTFVGEQFATVFIADFDIIKRKLTYYSFGHVPVMHYSSITDDINYLYSTTSFIGFDKIVNYKHKIVKFDRGDVFLLLTDGVVECSNKNYEIFGIERIADIIKESPKEAIIANIKTNMLKFSKEELIDDDIAILQINMGN